MRENAALTVIRDDICRIRKHWPLRIHSVASDVELNQTQKFPQAPVFGTLPVQFPAGSAEITAFEGWLCSDLRPGPSS